MKNKSTTNIPDTKADFIFQFPSSFCLCAYTVCIHTVAVAVYIQLYTLFTHLTLIDIPFPC